MGWGCVFFGNGRFAYWLQVCFCPRNNPVESFSVSTPLLHATLCLPGIVFKLLEHIQCRVGAVPMYIDWGHVQEKVLLIFWLPHVLSLGKSPLGTSSVYTAELMTVFRMVISVAECGWSNQWFVVYSDQKCAFEASQRWSLSTYSPHSRRFRKGQARRCIAYLFSNTQSGCDGKQQAGGCGGQGSTRQDLDPTLALPYFDYVGGHRAVVRDAWKERWGGYHNCRKFAVSPRLHLWCVGHLKRSSFVCGSTTLE